MDGPTPLGTSFVATIDALGRRRIATWVLVAIGATAVGWWLARPAADPVELTLPTALAAPASAAGPLAAEPSEYVVVHVGGAVAAPGVYRVLADARVTDLIDAAGGPLPDADLDQLNLAAPVVDGSRVVVPRVGEVLATGSVDAPRDTPVGPLDLNRATADQLDELPGVGPSTANAIVQHRDDVGGFQSVDELLDVRGIGPAKLDAIRDLVTV
jgi:competence protein ComEA